MPSTTPGPVPPPADLPPLDTADMQGLVARAYGHLPAARYLLLEVGDPAAARAWLASVVQAVGTAERRDDPSSLAVAFTWAGLRAFGVDDDALATFPRALREGMVGEHRSRVLGDVGASAPARWDWGAPGDDRGEIHLLVALYEADGDRLDEAHQACRAAFEAGGGLREVVAPLTGSLAGGSEHFGFADGLSQPRLRGWPRSTTSVHPKGPPQPARWSEVEPGEIVLGYPDNYGKPARGPTVAAGQDAAGRLPAAPWAPGRHHLGHNGSYLVFRQLAQDVAAFRRYVGEAAAAATARGEPLSPAQVGAKLVGRWASGASLTVFPDRDPGEAGTNDFGYHESDQAGLACPLGAHVRRANPRDSSPDHPDEALGSSRNHRILRRGRLYGAPLVEGSSVPEEGEGAERGLLFVCLNGDLERQFEFVQHTWLENRAFAGLAGEADPVTGSHPVEGGAYTVQARPVRRRMPPVPRLVTTRGGAYFFLPGIQALGHLAAGGG